MLPSGWNIEQKVDSGRNTRTGDTYISPAGKRYKSVEEVKRTVLLRPKKFLGRRSTVS